MSGEDAAILQQALRDRDEAIAKWVQLISNTNYFVLWNKSASW